MRRRRALQVVGGCLSAPFAGCVAGGQMFETYRYETDAPIDGLEVKPCRTRAYDAQRSGYIPYGRLPLEPTGSLFDFARQPIEMQPAFVDGVVYFGARQAVSVDFERYRPSGLKAADTADKRGNEWFFLEEDPIASPTVAGNAIFVTSNGMTRALDRRDGTLCWAYHQGTSYPSASPTFINDTVYITGERVFALAATTGEIQWATSRPDVSLRGTAANKDGVFATAGSEGQGTVYRYDLETGREQWATSTSSAVLVPPVLGEFVYIVEANGRLLALNRADGTEAWSQELDDRSSAMPAVAEGTVYAVAANGGILSAFDAATGEPQWQFTFDARSTTGPTIARNTVYLPVAVENGGIIHALAADSGRVRGSYELPQAPATPLVIGYGVGLIGTGRPPSMTRLYLLTTPSSPTHRECEHPYGFSPSEC